MAEPQGNGGKSGAKRGRQLQAPRGTRDFYPEDMRRRRWIEDTWRAVSVRHGFEEVDGPRFEHLELYTVKSGEGIVSELFSFTRAGGETALALRPEFTPTAARMVAAKASALAKPIKWFSVGPYFRAERPQRGRLREFLQWNVDVFGTEGDWSAEVELISLVIDFFSSIGLSSKDIRIKLGHRESVIGELTRFGIGEDKLENALDLLDRRPKMRPDQYEAEAMSLGFSADAIRYYHPNDRLIVPLDIDLGQLPEATASGYRENLESPNSLEFALNALGLLPWCEFDSMVVRGLAYYTGLVFEVHEAGGKERAIAGGGRYDNLIELFGGPPTPAVGFAMGDVVLSLVLEDKGLMPGDTALRERTGQRVDVFVIAGEGADALLAPAVAGLRRAGLHARHTHKATRNVGKQLKEASSLGARFAAILESDADSPEQVTLKDLATGEQAGVSLSGLAAELIRRARGVDIPSADA